MVRAHLGQGCSVSFCTLASRVFHDTRYVQAAAEIPIHKRSTPTTKRSSISKRLCLRSSKYTTIFNAKSIVVKLGQSHLSRQRFWPVVECSSPKTTCPGEYLEAVYFDGFHATSLSRQKRRLKVQPFPLRSKKGLLRCSSWRSGGY